ncbi:MAG: transglycosylase domain-containing protein [Candidatus Levybacteria bacterium]|nr:transglycosylase domain-containing protein [Candidatus Levybacteria bacterium]
MIGYRSRRSNGAKLFLYSRLSTYLFFALIIGIIFIITIFAWFSKDLPTPGKLSASNLSQSTKILDRNGIVLYDIYRKENRTYVDLKDISKFLQEGTIAIEDKNFYTESGYSLIGYLRAIRNAIFFRRISGGGSTLTQQLVKITLLTAEQTLSRKIKELILAIQVDKRYSKSQILELYLNVAPYGGEVVGVEAASQLYFGKHAKDINLIEGAILAGMPQRPSYFSPYGQNPKAFESRTKDVLRRMLEDGYINKKQEMDSINALSKIKFLKKVNSIKAPHFSFYVKDLLIKQFGEDIVEQGGLQVTTTLDYLLQEKAENIINEEVTNVSSLRVGNGASVVINPQNGEILAMIGSRDFFATESAGKNKKSFDGQFNVITQALRQPGSIIKPVMYAAALSRGYTPSTLIMDTKTIFPNKGEKDYEPVNYDGKYHGPVQMRFALGSSLNIPAVKMLAMIGIKNMLSTAYSMGMDNLESTSENIKKFGLSITLGGGDIKPLSLATSYSAFANGGYKVDPVAIMKVADRKGKMLYENKNVSKKRVIGEDVAFLISHMLLDNNARLITFGENSYLNIRGREVAVKTGTTDDKRDNWTIGWTPHYLVMVWVGNNDNSPMGNIASGVTGAAPIWRRLMLDSLKGKPSEDFVIPKNVTAVTIDAYSGGLPLDGKPTRVEYFIKGTEPQSISSIYKELKISKSDSNKLASDSEIDKNEYDIKKFILLKEEDFFSGDGKNHWQEGIDAWLNQNFKDDKTYHPPVDKSDRIISNSPTPAPAATSSSEVNSSLTTPSPVVLSE